LGLKFLSKKEEIDFEPLVEKNREVEEEIKTTKDEIVNDFSDKELKQQEKERLNLIQDILDRQKPKPEIFEEKKETKSQLVDFNVEEDKNEVEKVISDRI